MARAATGHKGRKIVSSRGTGQLGFAHFERMSDPAVCAALLTALERRGPGPDKALVRANLLRRAGDLAAARTAYAEYCDTDGQPAIMPHAWSAIPPGLVQAGHAVAPLVLIDDFLPVERMQAMYRYACDHEQDFDDRTTPAANHGDAPDIRMVLNSRFSLERAFFNRFLTENLATLRQCLGLPAFELAHIELKMMNNIDGGYMIVHTDHNGIAATQGRAITCLYYFGDGHPQFEGGELLVLDSIPHRARFSQSWFTRILPRQNRFVAFPSWFFHTVTPAAGMSGDFAKGRMALSCQIRKTADSMRAWWEDAV